MSHVDRCDSRKRINEKELRHARRSVQINHPPTTGRSLPAHHFDSERRLMCRLPATRVTSSRSAPTLRVAGLPRHPTALPPEALAQLRARNELRLVPAARASRAGAARRIQHGAEQVPAQRPRPRSDRLTNLPEVRTHASGSETCASITHLHLGDGYARGFAARSRQRDVRDRCHDR